jgi:hypothetical protein
MAALFLVGLALAVVVGIKVTSKQTTTIVDGPSGSVPVQSSDLVSGNGAISQPPVSVSGKMEGVVIKDSDIEKLAAGVGIEISGSTPSSAPKPVGPTDSQQWAKSIQQAQEMLQGMCSCHQRNWLLQFIDCGNYAVAGDPKYNEAVRQLATVPISE